MPWAALFNTAQAGRLDL